MGAALSDRLTDWMIIISLAAGVLMILARFVDQARVSALFRFPWQAQAEEFSLQFNSGKVNLNADRLLILAGCLLFPLLIIGLKVQGQMERLLLFDLATYARILLLAGLYLIFKLLLASAVGYAFEREEESMRTQNVALAHFTWIALIGGPLALVSYFLPLGVGPYYLVLLLVSLTAIVFLIRSVYYSLKAGISSGYIILYLCALEIIPLLFLYSLA